MTLCPWVGVLGTHPLGKTDSPIPGGSHVMKRISARRMVSACAITAASVAALAAPGAASASTGELCTGESTFAAGSSFQALAQQQVWSLGFNKAKEKSLFACDGEHGPTKGKPTI